MTEYERWLNQPLDDPDLTEELQSIQGQEEEINDRFYMDLEFGTAGLRGVIGAGTNRMNVYTVRKATQGLANYLLKHANGKPQSVAIAHDSRNKGVLFCQQSAAVLAANGIKAYLYPQLMPTPALSFAVRHLQCDAGICVTASHNPAKYNGYKAYGSDGCQITSDMADGITQEIKSLDIFSGVKRMDFEEGVKQGLIEYIGGETVDAFLDAVYQESLIDDASNLKLVYTPLNGAGKTCVLRILERIGIRDVTVVPEQAEPDGNFPTCPYPNPEFREALQKGLELCEQVQPDLLLATDPDSDRVGIAVKQGGEFKLMTGNEVGILLLDFIARVKEQALGETVMKSLNPSQMVVKIVHDEITDLLGTEETEIHYQKNGITTVMMVGLQGTGKTTASAKIANLMKKKQGRRPLLVACDVYRPAAIKQLEVVGGQLGIPVFRPRSNSCRRWVRASAWKCSRWVWRPAPWKRPSAQWRMRRNKAMTPSSSIPRAVCISMKN